MRPSTLCEAADRAGADPSGRPLAEFLDEFYLESDDDRRCAMLAGEPSLQPDARANALFGAVAKYLSKRYQLKKKMPKWCLGPARYLPLPWHTTGSTDPGMIEFLTYSSPAEFRSRNIFTGEAPLRGTRTPRL